MTLFVYRNPNCVPIIYINVMLPCLSRMTQEAARFQQAARSRRGEAGQNLFCVIRPLTAGRQAGNFMMTGRMAKGWGQGGEGGQPGMARSLYRAEEAHRRGSTWWGAIIRTVLGITDWTRRTAS